MLIPEQEQLLKWLSRQPSGVSLTQMEKCSAPHFTCKRIHVMREAGLLDTELVFEGSSLVAYYKPSDKAREALQTLEEKRRKESEEKSEKHRERIHDIVLLILGALLGLLTERLPDIATGLVSFLRIHLH